MKRQKEMLNEGPMLCVQYNETNKSIDILCDVKGIDALIDVLTKLRGTNNHAHIRGGDKLDLKSPYGGEVYGELVINAFSEDPWLDINAPTAG
jgi:hypothetical protein